jgi:hypothetical protein
MRYWFFAILLANVIFFLWEFHYGAFEPAESPDTALQSGEKQILLVREVNGDSALTQRPAPHLSLPDIADIDLPPIAIDAEPAGNAGRGAEQNDALLLDAQQPASQGGEPEAVEQLPPELAVPENMADVEPVTEPPAVSEIAQTAEPTADTAAEPPSAAENTQIQTPQAEPAIVKPNETDSAAPEPAAPPEPSKTEAVQTACYVLGPVKSADALNALLNQYRPQLAAVELSATEKRKNDSHLVYYPAAASQEQALANAEMLRNNYGIKDLLLFRSGELQGAISLGVFSNEQRAKLAQNQFEKKGLHTEIRPRYPAEAHYSVRARWSEAQAAAAKSLSDALQKTYPPMGRTVSACADKR